MSDDDALRDALTRLTHATRQHAAAELALRKARAELNDAEDEVLNCAGHCDSGFPVIHGGIVYVLPDEYWERPKGDRIAVLVPRSLT